MFSKPSKSKKKTHKRLYEVKDVAKAGFRIHKYVFAHQPLTSTIYIILIILLALAPFLGSWILNKMIDAIVYSASNGLGLTIKIKQLLIFLISLGIATSVLNAFRRYMWDITRFNLMENLTIKMTTKYSVLDLEYYEDPKFNDLLQKVRENYDFRPTAFLGDTYHFIEDVVEIATSVAIIFAFNVLLIPIVFFSVLPELISNIVIGKRRWSIWDTNSETIRNYWTSANYLEKENTLTEIKVFRARKYILNLIEKLFKDFTQKQKTVERSRALNDSVLGIIGGIGYGIAILVVTLSVVAGEITLGLFTFYRSSINRLQRGIRNLLHDISDLFENGLFVKDIFEVFDLEPKIVDGTKRLQVNGTPPLIEFENVWFKYPNANKYVFKNLNFVLHPKQNFAIVGKNGAGKTTMVKLICRFYDVTKGKILINGVDIKKLNIDDWYKNIALLSQNFVKFHYDAKTNIALGNISKHNNIKAVKKAAILSGADEFIKEYEHGYNQVLSKRFPNGTEPSTGQWQKIALARAFYKDAPILILDEPTSAIDPQAEFEIFEKLLDYAKDKTLLIVSHRFSTVRNASKIIVLDKGKIIEQGSHYELIELNGEYKKAYELQKRGYAD